jgi:hypothetical protein
MAEVKDAQEENQLQLSGVEEVKLNPFSLFFPSFLGLGFSFHLIFCYQGSVLIGLGQVENVVIVFVGDLIRD